MATTRLHIDWTACDGRGLCAELLPHLIGRDEWGYPAALTGGVSARSDIPIGQADLEAADEAVALCPLVALRLLAD
ncbi:ferredoxin [Diaminobutyricibacter sp. McL0608]|uniref:ferredoxin n=1 Tax=Leifsonia sp. McL0608 TaxID=3143537 RepID=UPI0031F33140